MVAAYLRGLLKPSHRFGIRSIVSEEVILESIHALDVVAGIEQGVAADLAMLPVLNEKGRTRVVESSNTRLARAAELRTLDIYRVADQISGTLRRLNRSGEVSLFQLYQIAEKTGIFEAFQDHYTVDKATPLL